MAEIINKGPSENIDEGPIKYIVKEKSLIGNEIHEAGAIVTLPEGTLPAENLTPIDARGEAKYQEYLDSNAKRVAAMNAGFPGPPGADLAAFGALIQAAVRAGIEAYAAEQSALQGKTPAKVAKGVPADLA